jgi:hypothetical protein
MRKGARIVAPKAMTELLRCNRATRDQRTMRAVAMI